MISNNPSSTAALRVMGRTEELANCNAADNATSSSEFTLVVAITSFDRSTKSEFFEIFKTKQDYAGTKWDKVSYETHMFYLEEFQKYFFWKTRNHNDIIWCFYEMTQVYYNEWVMTLKENRINPWFMPEEIWDSWKVVWIQEKYEASLPRFLAPVYSPIASTTSEEEGYPDTD